MVSILRRRRKIEGEGERGGGIHGSTSTTPPHHRDREDDRHDPETSTVPPAVMARRGRVCEVFGLALVGLPRASELLV